MFTSVGVFLTLCNAKLFAANAEQYLRDMSNSFNKISSSNFNYTCKFEVSYEGSESSAHFEADFLNDGLHNRQRIRSLNERGGWDVFIQISDKNMTYFEGAANISINSGLSCPNDQGMTRAFDGLVATIAGTSGVLKGEKLSEAVSSILERTFTISSESNSEVVLFYQNQTAGVETYLTLSKGLGFLPVEQKSCFTGTDKIVSSSRTTWTQYNAIVVPESVTTTTLSKKKMRQGFLSYEWIAVPEVIPDSEFAIEAFNAPVGTDVLNCTLGVPFIERKIGMDIPQQVIDSNNPTLIVRTPSSSLRSMLLPLLVAFNLTILCWFMVRTIRTRMS